MKFDLHCHSHFSDGALSPQALADYAHERQLDLLALTDHDTISGIQPMQSCIDRQSFNLKLIPGVEISALSSINKQEVHVLGLGIDPSNPQLKQKLDEQIEKRWHRARKICDGLSRVGIPEIYQHMLNNVKQVVTRSHIAQALVDLDYVKDKQQAFKKYLGNKAKIKATKEWMSLAEVISLIHQAGGISVLAHPTRYRLSSRKLRLLLEQFSQDGGMGIEMSYPSLTADKAPYLQSLRKEFNFLASSGSDFHFPDLRWTDLGRFPPLPAELPHVLHQLLKTHKT